MEQTSFHKNWPVNSPGRLMFLIKVSRPHFFHFLSSNFFCIPSWNFLKYTNIYSEANLSNWPKKELIITEYPRGRLIIHNYNWHTTVLYALRKQQAASLVCHTCPPALLLPSWKLYCVWHACTATNFHCSCGAHSSHMDNLYRITQVSVIQLIVQVVGLFHTVFDYLCNLHHFSWKGLKELFFLQSLRFLSTEKL